jgi:hypothetical protein
MDVYSRKPQLLDIAVRFDNEPECYGWTTKNYTHLRWRNPEWRLAPNRYLVKIDVDADAAATSATFLLINDATGFRLKAQPNWFRRVISRSRHPFSPNAFPPNQN